MSEQLYRIHRPDGCICPELVDVVPSRILDLTCTFHNNDGTWQMKPVVPDYEAGIEYLDSIESLMTRSEMVALLDAALGATHE